MADYIPIDYDPFASDGGVPTEPGQNGRPTRVVMNMGQPSPASAEPKYVPVDYDPFAPSSALGDIAKSVGGGLVKGVAGLATLPQSMHDLAGTVAGFAADQTVGRLIGGGPVAPHETVPTALDRLPSLPRQGDVVKAVEDNVTGQLHHPETTAGRYAERIAEFVPAAAAGPGGVLANILKLAVAPAVASEYAGEQTAGTSAEPWARAAGAITGGGFASLASRPGTAARAVAQQMPEGITPQIVDKAQALIATAKQQGIDLAWPEALSQVAGRPVLTNMMRHLEASPQTEAQMAEFFGNRPRQVDAAARNTFDDIALINPAPSSIGPAIGRAAEGTLNDVRGAINKTAEPFYDRAAPVLLTRQEMEKVRAIPGYDEAAAAVRNDPQLNRYVANLPDYSVGFLNEVKKQLDNAAENATQPMTVKGRNMQRAAGFGQDAKAVRSIATSTPTSTDLATALAIESVGREKYLQPLLDGPLGKLAAKDTTTQQAIEALFPKSPLANSEIEIGTTVSALAKRNPDAASDLVRAHAESTFNNAARDLQTGANQAGGAKFRIAIAGNAQQRLNLREAVEALPNGTARWAGFNKLLDTLEATGTRQHVGSRTAYNDEINKLERTGGIVRAGMKVAANPAKLAQPLIDKFEQWKLGKNLGDLANILTDPRSGPMLKLMAQAPAGSLTARVIAANAIHAFGSRSAEAVK